MGTTIAITLVAMMVLVLLVQAVLASTVKQNVHELLRAHADAVAATLVVTDGRLVKLETPTETLDRSTWVFDASGGLVEGPSSRGYLRDAVQGLATTPRTVTTDVTGIRLFATPVTVSGTTGKAVVVTAVDLDPYERTERYALIVSLVLGGLVVLGTAGVALWSLHRALQPVSVMAERARDWSEHDLDRRFDLGAPRDEISSLATTFDDLLDRVAEVIRSEQRLSHEMAHELRTPLTSVRAEAELAALRTDLPVETTASLGRIVAAADVMSEAITTLMELARSGRGVGRARVLDLLRAVAEQLAGPMSIVIDDVPPVLLLAVPQEMAVRALSPLVANAAQHATTQVRLQARVDRHAIEVHVLDDGPGLAAGVDVEALFAPGVRGADSRGSGLGLPLARRVARSAGGDVQARPDSCGGHFVLTLPIAAPGPTVPVG